MAVGMTPCPVPRRPMTSQEFLAWCRKHAADIVAALAAFPVERRPMRRTMRAVAERLDLLNLPTAHRAVMAQRDVWWPEARRRRRAPGPGDDLDLVVSENPGDGGLYVRLPVDGFYGVIGGDVLAGKLARDLARVHRKDGA